MATKDISVILHMEQMEPISCMSKQQKGEVLEAIIAYMNGEEYKFEDPMCHMAFGFIKRRIDHDREKYNDKCNKNREIALAREKNKRERTSTNVHERARTCTNVDERTRTTTNSTNTNSNSNTNSPSEKNNPLTPFEGDGCAVQMELAPVESKKGKKRSRGMTKEQVMALPYSDEFEASWSRYPRKDGKGDAWWAYWQASQRPGFPGSSLADMIKSRSMEDDWQRDGGRYVPHMSTWLNRNGWEDAGCAPVFEQIPNDRQELFDKIWHKYNGGNPGPNGPWDRIELEKIQQQMVSELHDAGFTDEEIWG